MTTTILRYDRRCRRCNDYRAMRLLPLAPNPAPVWACCVCGTVRRLSPVGSGQMPATNGNGKDKANGH